MITELNSTQTVAAPRLPQFRNLGSDAQSGLDSVLIVDDDEAIRSVFSLKLRSAGFKVTTAENLKAASSILQKESFKAVLLDLFLEDGNGLDIIGDILFASPHTKVVILSGHNSIDFAINATNKGASGFLVKTNSPEENIAKFRLLISDTPSEKSDMRSCFEKVGIVGASKAMHGIADKIQRLRHIESTVLLCGESGTGKEIFARAIHKLSNRTNGPFIAINCAAISETILESELFGYKAGAFTDAKKDRKGYFETCSQGTLFLDEIGEMSPGLQAKLLRVLQEKEVTPLGSCIPVPVNTRIIAATNRDLDKEVAQNRFRMDLFYRLAVFQIDLPALRERRTDIPLLTTHFMDKFNKQYNRQVRYPSKVVSARMQAYDWPGNVRELHNALERAVVMAPRDEIQLEDLLPRKVGETKIDSDSPARNRGVMALDYKEAKEAFERDYIENLLSQTAGNVAEAARVSHQYRPNIYRLIHKFKIDPTQFKKH